MVGNWVTGWAIPRRNACIFYSCRDLWALLKPRGGCCSNQSRSQIPCSANNKISILHNSSHSEKQKDRKHSHQRKFSPLSLLHPLNISVWSFVQIKIWSHLLIEYVNTILVQIFHSLTYTALVVEQKLIKILWTNTDVIIIPPHHFLTIFKLLTHSRKQCPNWLWWGCSFTNELSIFSRNFCENS